MSTDTYLTQLGFTHYAFHRNVDGLSHEESLRSPSPAGNCLNWVVGHLVATRSGWLEALGGEPLLEPATKQTYRRGSAPLGDGGDGAALPFADLVAAFDRSQGELQRAIAAMTDEQLDGPAPFSPGKNPDETWRSLTAAMLLHEAYHVGQTGVLRRLLGKPGAIT